MSIGSRAPRPFKSRPPTTLKADSTQSSNRPTSPRCR